METRELVIENTVTKARRVIPLPEDGRIGRLEPGEKVLGTFKAVQAAQARKEMAAKFDAYAADFGLKPSIFRKVGGWLLGCAYCQTAGELTELLEKGLISREAHRQMFLDVANAKDQGDEAALKALKGKLEALRNTVPRPARAAG